MTRKKKKVKKPVRKQSSLSRAELFKNVKFINLILSISKSKKVHKVYREYTAKLVNLFR